MAAVKPDTDPDIGEPVVEEVVAALDRDGYAIAEGVLARTRAHAIRDELRDLLEPVPNGRNDFEGFATRRLYALYAKTRVLDDLTLHPLVLGALERVLGPHFQLSGPTGIDIGPGEVQQEVARTLPKRLRELLGYDVYPPFLGYVDGRHPDRVLGPGPLPA